MRPIRKEGEQLKEDLKKLQKDLENPTLSEDEKAVLLTDIETQKNLLDALDKQGREKIGKRQASQIVELFKDVNEAAKAYAEEKGILVVLAYGEQLDGDLFDFKNLNRKMQGMDLGSTSPIYIHPRAEITQAITESLNKAYLRKKPRND